jgi:hypothetical protein
VVRFAARRSLPDAALLVPRRCPRNARPDTGRASGLIGTSALSDRG